MNDSAPVSSPDRQLVNALSRGLLILACFRVSRPLLTNGQLAEYSELPRSSVSRLTHTLVKLGYLEYDSRHAAYRLGAKVLSLSYAMLGGMAMRPLILPHMTELAERANSLVALAACEDYSMLIVEAVMGRNTLAQPLEVGSHMALDTTAMGRAYLASCSASEQKKTGWGITVFTCVEQRETQSCPETPRPGLGFRGTVAGALTSLCRIYRKGLTICEIRLPPSRWMLLTEIDPLTESLAPTRQDV